VLPEEWADVIADFPRSLTLPDLIWPLDDGRYLTVDRSGHPQEWARWADADVAPAGSRHPGARHHRRRCQGLAGRRERESTTRLGRTELDRAEFFIGLRVPAAVHTSAMSDDDTTVLFVYGLDDRSWAAVFHCDDGT
jgi:hypothetical protein